LCHSLNLNFNVAKQCEKSNFLNWAFSSVSRDKKKCKKIISRNCRFFSAFFIAVIHKWCHGFKKVSRKKFFMRHHLWMTPKLLLVFKKFIAILNEDNKGFVFILNCWNSLNIRRKLCNYADILEPFMYGFLLFSSAQLFSAELKFFD
jgi:hypothetical protein